MRIGVMGAGGIGGYVGGRLAQVGMDVTLVARGAHLETLRDQGLTLETPEGRTHVPTVRAVGDPADVGPVNLVLLTVKLGDVKAAAQAMMPMVGPQTVVVTLQNGIDSPGMLAKLMDPARIAPAIIYLAANIKTPGTIWHPGGINLLKVDTSGSLPAIAELVATDPQLEMLQIVGDNHPEQMLWGKFVNLSALAGITCLTRSPIGRVLEHEASRAYLMGMVDENYAVAQAAGIGLPEGAKAQFAGLVETQPYSQKSSMLLDLEAGKPIELPWLCGRMAALGREHGVPTPNNDAVVAALAPFVNGNPDG